jgi:DNA phosphorothioation-dependent restriction protein DptG
MRKGGKCMTELLEKAFAEVAKLSANQQDEIAQRLLDELSDDEKWEESFTRSEKKLRFLVEEALNEHRSGSSEELIVENL